MQRFVVRTRGPYLLGVVLFRAQLLVRGPSALA